MPFFKETEMDVCHACAVVIVNGDASADEERAERAFDTAFGIYGDDLQYLTCNSSEESDDASQQMFRCDYCREDVYDWLVPFVIMVPIGA
jgi:hypothetical protein